MNLSISLNNLLLYACLVPAIVVNGAPKNGGASGGGGGGGGSGGGGPNKVRDAPFSLKNNPSVLTLTILKLNITESTNSAPNPCSPFIGDKMSSGRCTRSCH